MGDTFFTNLGFSIHNRSMYGPWTFRHPSFPGAYIISDDLHEFVCFNATPAFIDFVCVGMFGELGEIDWFNEQRNIAAGYGFVFDRFVTKRYYGVRFKRGGQTMTLWQNKAVCAFDCKFYESVVEFLAANA